MSDRQISLAAEQDRRVRDKLRRELGSVVSEYLEDPDTVEIVLNPDGQLWVEQLGKPMIQAGVMAASQAEQILATIASIQKTEINRNRPIIECELPYDGSRFEGLLPPVVSAPTFAIRRRASRVFSLDEYVTAEIMSAGHADAIRRAVDDKQNILVVGGTGTGKTTLTNAIIRHMSEHWPDQRLVLIEDTNELQCESPNAVTLRATIDTDMVTLLRATLRLRPDRILVGEVRGPEALVLIDSWNTGHPGGVATVHANNAAAGLVRLEALVRRGLAGSPVPTLEIATAINVIVSIKKVPGGRRVEDVLRVIAHDGSNYITESAL